MKELQQHLGKHERTELHAQKQQQKETQKVLEGVIKPKPGQIVWEINITTLEIKEAQYKQTDIDFTLATDKDFSTRKELLKNPDCVYIPALNKKNALKKFHQSASQSSYYAKKPIFDIKNIYNPAL